ncbi:pentatricopeptide repeat-containing protein At2g03380, mitochondrial [Cynara cardunculus var. scolymus]|uniref:pentatricopeptide repeat-containing protein At2g03380, mitochondrial n=1 Tax=Cynara cardunculus var. scolymus TaxID=59895 RepID=UPI000D628FEE|nr:pentatricopeptide repeat-containing protein At2g03380, mitochondrial [Cynara cardunculus var. scolymus]
MIKLKTLLQLCFHRSKFFQPRFHYRTLNSSVAHQKVDPSIAYINFISSNPLFSLLGLCRNLSSLKELHSSLIVDGQSTQLNLQTKLVSLYGSLGDMESARLVFDQMPNPDIFSFKVMIRWYFINDLHFETIGFYKCLRKCLKENDNVVFSIVVKACTELRDIDEGRKVHCHIVKAGSPDSFILTSLVDMYAKCGNVKCSRRVFDDIVGRDVVSWTSMIVAYVQNDCAEEALVLFNRMRSGLIEGNQHTFGSIISACTKLRALHQGKWVHGYAIKNGIDLNPHLVTSLVDMYVKCGAILDARSAFDELSTVDLVSWTAMVVGYSQNGYPNEAIVLFTDMKRIDILPNSVTISSVISSCSQLGDREIGKAIHCVGVKLGLEDGNVRNALVDMYAKCEMIEDARYLFDSYSNKDLVTWNSIINGYGQSGRSYEVMKLFHRMRSEGFHPDAVTLVILLSCFASFGDLRIGSSLHAYSIKRSLSCDNNVYIGTALLHFYAKCGKQEAARRVFDGMGEKNTVSWNALIGGYGMQGDCNSSIAVFNEMLKENLDPNDATFTAILSACSHTGTFEGWKFFDLMCREFEFVPKMDHYGCLVDLLARSGRLEEAFDFIRNMPVKPDVSLIGSFLHGCSMHSRFDLGEVAVRWMFDQHPIDASYYVLGSNLYASDGRWSGVFEVRELMKLKDLSKLPGCSLELHNASSGLNHAAPLKFFHTCSFHH